MNGYIPPARHALLAALLGLGAFLLLVQPADAQGQRQRGGRHSQQGQCVRQAARDLGLTEEQRGQIKALRMEQGEAVRPLRERLRERAQALRAEEPDATRRELAQDPEIQELRSEIHSVSSAYREKIDAVLTEEQRVEMERIREACKAQRPRSERGTQQRGGGEIE